MLISVVIPCYNQAHFLGEAIGSVLAQEGRPRFEVVVVDDGSTDNTSEVAGRYPGVRLVRQENRGLSAARNAGLGRSVGEYVVFLDADDRLLPGALEAGVERLAARPGCAFVHGHYKDIAVDGSPYPEWPQPDVGTDRSYVAFLQLNRIPMHATAMFRRAVLESVGGFDNSLRACEDWDLYLRVAREFSVCSHEKVVAEYRHHGTNMSHGTDLMLSTSVAVLRKQRKYAKENEQYRKAYETGIKFCRDWYGDQLVDKVRAHIREREWKRALGGALVLLRYHPRGLALLSERRMERHKLARRLQKRKQELEIRERQLRLHERRLRALDERPGDREGWRVEELEGTLAEERREVQQLRRRIRRLALRIQGPDRRGARSGRVPGAGELLERLGRVRARLLGR